MLEAISSVNAMPIGMKLLHFGPHLHVRLLPTCRAPSW